MTLKVITSYSPTKFGEMMTYYKRKYPDHKILKIDIVPVAKSGYPHVFCYALIELEYKLKGGLNNGRYKGFVRK